MWRKTIIIHLLLVMALLPAAQAVGPVAMPADSDRQAHELMVMDCGQVDPDHCIDFNSCASGSHASCDAKTKSAQLPPELMDQTGRHVLVPHAPGHYLSPHADLLLRPPRNA